MSAASTIPAPPDLEEARRDLRNVVAENMVELSRRCALLGLDGWSSTCVIAAKSTLAEMAHTAGEVQRFTHAAQIIESQRGTWVLALEIGAMRALAARVESTANTLMGAYEAAEAAKTATGGTGT